MPSFEHDHFYLLELLVIFEPQSSYQFYYTFALISEELSHYEPWKPTLDGPIATEAIYCTPNNWNTQY